MGILGWIFKRPSKEETIERESFGIVKKDEHGFWEGEISNNPIIGHTVEFCVKSEKFDDVVERLILSIINNYENIYAEIRNKIFEGLDDFTDGISKDDFFKSMVFSEIRIWDVASDEWELIAETPLNDHLFVVQIKNMRYVGFSMDG